MRPGLSTFARRGCAHGLLALAVVLLLAGCPGARYGGSFRSSTGTAMAKPGVSGGTTNVLRVADVGGPLSRAGLYAMAAMVAAGAVETESTSRTYRSGDYIVTETTTTVTGVDENAMATAQTLLDTAASKESIQALGIQSSLEIATRYLGGDTSGWMYNVGYGSRPFLCGPRLVCNVYGGVGFGKYTFHDRVLRARVGAGTSGEIMDDSTYAYFGSPLRLTITPGRYVGAYVQADLNWATLSNQVLGNTGSPSPWRVGAELRYRFLFARVELAAARMVWASTSTQLEVGLGF